MIVGPTSTVVQLCRPNHHTLGPYAWPTMTGQRSQHKSSALAGRVGPTLAYSNAANQHIWTIIRSLNVLGISLHIISSDIMCYILVHIIGPIPWGHSVPLCHALSLLSLSLLSMLLWTSMRKWRATVATPGE